MINALFTIALVQSLGFAADVRLALRRCGFNHGFSLGALYSRTADSRAIYLRPVDWFDPLTDRLFRSKLPLLQLRLTLPLLYRQAGALEPLETESFRRSGRETWHKFAGSMPC